MNRLYIIHVLKRISNKYSYRGKNKVDSFLKKITPEMQDNLIVRTKYGFKLKVSPVTDKGIERSIFNKGTYEDGTLWCFKKILQKKFIVVDAGANIGLTSIHSSKLVGKNGKVFSFEAMPSTFKILEYNIRLNKLNNILPINYALGNQEGEVEIFPKLYINRGAASLYSDKKGTGIKIPITTLDKIVEQYLIENIDFIKIDIEGAEYPMLLGSKSFFKTYKKPIICVEFSKKVKSDYNAILIYDLLVSSYNYRIFKQKRGKESQTPLIEIFCKEELPNHDNIYCFQDYHFNFLPADLFLNT